VDHPVQEGKVAPPAEFHSQGFWVGDWRVRPASGELVRNGQVTKVEPKVMAVLELLASRPGAVVTRKELEERVWTGTVVGYDAVTKAIIKLREALQDDRKHPQVLETLPKKGYRLIAPVSRETPGAGPQVEAAPPAAQRKRYPFVFAALGLMLVAGVVAWWTYGVRPQMVTPSAPEMDSPSIAVIPFQNLSGGSEDDYLAAGLTSELVTDLSQLRPLTVIATRSVLPYREAEADLNRLREEFDVRYFLTGSFARVGDRLRLNVHLIEADRHTVLWSARYERARAEYPELQAELVHEIAETLSVQVSDEERRRLARRYTYSMEAYDYFLRAQASLHERTAENNAFARAMYRQALAVDPGFARALAGLALTYAMDHRYQWPSDVQHPLDRALVLAREALSMEQEVPEVHWVLGYVYSQQQENDKAREAVAPALALNPNYADGYALLASLYVNAGQPEQALPLIRKALRLNPWGGYQYLLILGRTYYYLGRHAQAVQVFERARVQNPTLTDVLVYLQAVYQRLGRHDEADWMREELEVLDPDFDPERWLSTHPLWDQRLRRALLSDLGVGKQ
jgi:TolB-like protein/DNA-binding winged helix-turn-helix (wHTH) protein/Flp pilus assembly protein TadD